MKNKQYLYFFQDYNFVYKNQELRVTMTFGVCNSKNFETVDSMIAEADRLLYNGKISGKNSVRY
ncbi:hypothetical protein [Clostridium magnum]|nr:hypothetical protein [Clostridium magnum]